ncbi:chaplin family protein [Streptomyces sp. NPDC051909]|uniref:chaplin n=1 Tax=Streptomyces sp. NPDC051909 TaxID=3154944 RepID=UPI00341F86F4
MRQVTRVITRKSIITVAAAGGMIALGGGYAHASSGASGAASDSPGVASGNTVQVPVHAPVNVCGNTVSVIGLLNPAYGNSCANQSGSGTSDTPDSPGGYGDEGSGADGHTSDSPGVGSGNTVEVPIDAPVNICGNSVDGVGAGNAAYGNDCGYGVEPTHPGHPGTPETPGTPSTPPGGEGEHPGTPETPGTPGGSHGPNTPSTRSITPDRPTEELASTGAGPLGLIVPAGAGLLLAGSVIYRRARSAA